MKEEQFSLLLQQKWQEKFNDDGIGDWRKHWFLDGDLAKVSNTPEGMVFSAGQVARDDASHAVLWTRDNFAGDLKIEWDYTRLDSINRFVNIIYIQATGTGEPPFVRDIAEWSELRRKAAMKMYFDHMNLLHISYAAFNNDDDKPDDYVRARRYPTRPGRAFNQTDIAPDNFNTGLFLPGETYHFTFIKTDKDLFFEVKNATVRKLFHWPLTKVEPVADGRVGIRHMCTRSSRYRNITISTR